MYFQEEVFFSFMVLPKNLTLTRNSRTVNLQEYFNGEDVMDFY